MEERFRLRSSSDDPTSRFRLEAIKRQEFEKIRRLESEKGEVGGRRSEVGKRR